MGLVEIAALIFIVLTARWWLPVVAVLGCSALILGSIVVVIIFVGAAITGFFA